MTSATAAQAVIQFDADIAAQVEILTNDPLNPLAIRDLRQLFEGNVIIAVAAAAANISEKTLCNAIQRMARK